MLLGACVQVPTTTTSTQSTQTQTSSETKTETTTETTTTTAVAETGAEKITISVSLWDIENAFPEGQPIDKIAQYIYDKFNIEVEPMNVTWGDSSEKYNVWAASNTLPDIIGAMAIVGSAQYKQWIDEGLVRALPDNLSSYPNINKNMNLPEVTAYMVDGKNYMLPRMTYADARWWAMDRGVMYRKDWAEKLGFNEIKTEEDFVNLTAAMAKNDPDGNGQNDTIGLGANQVWPLFSQGFTNYGYTDGLWIKYEDGSWKRGYSGESIVKLLDMFRKVTKAGGMDPDLLARKNDETQDLFAAGQVGVFVKQNSPKHMMRIKNIWVPLNPDKEFTDSVGFMKLWSVDGKKPQGFVEKSYWSESYFSTAVDDAKMERILQLYDFLYGEEGMMLTAYGFDGEDYKKNADGLELLLPMKEDGTRQQIGEKYPSTLYLGSLGVWTGDLLQYISPAIDKDVLDICVPERDYRMNSFDFQKIDWEVQAIITPEKQESTADFMKDLGLIIMDTSNKSTQQLYDEAVATWDSQGYKAAWESITTAAKALGK